MSFTGKIGSPDSKLGNLILGFGAVASHVGQNTLSLTQSAGATIRYTKNVQASSSLVALAQSVVLGISNNKIVSQTIGITDFARLYRHIDQSITHSLSLTDDAEHGVFFKNATQSFDITDLATVLRLPTNTVSETLELSDSVRLSVRDLRASSLLSLTDAPVVVGPKYLSATDPFQITTVTIDPSTLTLSEVILGGLQDLATVIAIVTHPVHSIISLADHAIGIVVKSDGTELSASNTLSLTDVGRLSIQVAVSQSLVLTDTASAQSGLLLFNQLGLGHAVSVNIVRASLAASNTLSLGQAVAYTYTKSDVLCFYSPFVGAGSGVPTPPSVSLPTVADVTGFRLRYPSTGDYTDEIILRSPELGNVDRFTMDRINRETRGGTLIIFADPIWPKVETLVLSFSALKYEQAQGLLTFMLSHLGQEIRLIDHENRAWKGVIVDPQKPMVEDTRGRFTASFDFEGERDV